MLDCLILGDSIAVGTHQFKPQCATYAKSGINSRNFNKQYGHRDYGAEVVIISLGSNDPGAHVQTYDELHKLREHVKADRVYWILPNPEKFPKQAMDVEQIAKGFGDLVIGTKQYQADAVHPSSAGYKELAKSAE